MGIVYLDVNGLKDINDLRGHAFGDKVLVECARRMRETFDGADFYRIGGDEFVIICREWSKEVFEEKVELLRKNFERDSICRAAAGQREAMICPKSLRMQMQGCMRIRKNFTAGVLCPGATGTRATR